MHHHSRLFNSQILPVLIAPLLIGLAACAPAASKPSTSSVPAELQPPTGNTPFLKVAAQGVQIYVCTAKADATGFEWVFKAPEANLFNSSNQKVGTHYAGPTWEGLDGSKVVGEVKIRLNPSDASAIPWLLLSAKSTAGTGTFAQTTFIQRLETGAGKAPVGGCDAGKLAVESRVPYTANYVFFSASK